MKGPYNFVGYRELRSEPLASQCLCCPKVSCMIKKYSVARFLTLLKDPMINVVLLTL